MLSLGGRLVLINSVLTNMVMYIMSFFLSQKGVLHEIDYYVSRFLGKGIAKKRSIDWLSGMLYADPKIWVGWGSMTLR
jgi:hypothetical protein